jgi:hypothetical protein
MKDTNCAHFDKWVRPKLDSCKNADEMLSILRREYDLHGAPLSPITKVAFITGLRAAVRMIQPEVNEVQF